MNSFKTLPQTLSGVLAMNKPSVVSAIWLFLATLGGVNAQSIFDQPPAEKSRTSVYDDMQLPLLPESSALTRMDIGKRFRTESEQPVVFVGHASTGQALAFSLDDVKQTKVTFEGLVSSCAEKGPLWHVPEHAELQRFTPHVELADPSILPGGSWTNTQAACRNCRDQELLKIIYDVRSGAILSRYTLDVFRYYGVCVKRF